MKFISFGCWNNGMCTDENQNGMSLVLKDIKNKIDLYQEYIMFILGDNYYPKKINKVKQFNYSNFISGFNCLNSINLKKDLILGNHEINDIFRFEEKITKCHSINMIFATIYDR